VRWIRDLLGWIASFGGWHRRRRTSYSEFHLLIGKVRSTYFAKVISSPAGDGLGQVNLPDLRPRESRSPSRKGRGSRNLRVEPESAQEQGGDLFQAVFRGEVRRLWGESLARTEKGRGLLIKLRLEDRPELVGLPWECLYDRDRKTFFGLQTETPIVRYLAVPAEPFPQPAPRPTRILVLIANPQGTERLQIEQEFREVSAALSCLGERVRIERLERPSMALLASRLRECHVLHFIGHGAFDQKGIVILEGSDGQPLTLDVHGLATLFPSAHSIRLVVLNSCQGAQHSTGDVFDGVAQSLVQKGVPAVVAMRHDVDDELAIAFSSSLYQALSQGASIQEAVPLGRRAMLDEKSDAWSTPALYMRQDLEILPPPPLPWRWILGIGLLVPLSILGSCWLRQWNATRQCPSPPGLDIRFVKIPPGNFWMGAKRGKRDSTPAHRVDFKDSFCLAATEITQGQWFEVMGSTPSEAPGDNPPVAGVSWNDVQIFLEKLNQQEPGARYRLPTEAQWEYAARAGGDGIYGGGKRIERLPEYGNCNSEHDLFPRTSDVGSFKPNRWGLYDMHGNVSEWVADWFGPYSEKAQVDPLGPQSGERRVRRGGSWNTNAKNCSAVERNSSLPSYVSGDVGFRIVRDPIH
jgi:formylglycine-generating enzyme required for sulfatase activity